MDTLGIFVKQPVAGAVKTRLAREIGDERAAELYAVFLNATVAQHRHTAERRVLCFAPREAEAFFQSLSQGDYELWPQPEADLGERMRAFFAEHLRREDDRVVVIGSDSPTLPLEFVEQAFHLLGERECVIGPATDGGYYLLGLRGRLLPLFQEMSWSNDRVLEQTIDRLETAGCVPALLPVWYDVDTADDLRFLRGHVRALRHAETPLHLGEVDRILDAISEDSREST